MTRVAPCDDPHAMAGRGPAVLELIEPVRERDGGAIDEPASVWQVAGEVLLEAGETKDAAAAFAAGAAWVRAAADTIDDPALRKRWCEANATHRALLVRAG
jgi:hypothetical protein